MPDLVPVCIRPSLNRDNRKDDTSFLSHFYFGLNWALSQLGTSPNKSNHIKNDTSLLFHLCSHNSHPVPYRYALRQSLPASNNGSFNFFAHFNYLEFPVLPQSSFPNPVATPNPLLHSLNRKASRVPDPARPQFGPNRQCPVAGILRLVLRGRLPVRGRPKFPIRAGPNCRGGQGGATVPTGAPTVRDHGGSQTRYVRG